MIEETEALLNLWHDGMSTTQLSRAALDTGAFPQMSARRVRNVVVECFAPRYLVPDGTAAGWLKQLKSRITPAAMRQLYFLYTCRANEILADFVCDVYWPFYAAGKSEIHRRDAVDFVVRSNRDGKTTKLWSESTVRRVSSYVMGCCADFGLLESGASKTTREFQAFSLHRDVALFLSHDLHFSGLGDNAVIAHEDWKLFGLEPFDVIDQLRTLAANGHFVVQAAGGVVKIGWKYRDMQGVIDVLGG